MARFLPGATTLRPFLHKLRGVKIYGKVFIGDDVYIENEHPECVEIHEGVQIVLRTNIIAHFRGTGKIIFTCSLLTFQGGITVPGYAASKGGLGQLVMAFSNEWASRDVNVNGIAPGYIKTRNTEALQKDPERSKAILERIPQARWGDPEDLAGPVVFLASRASDYMNGSIVVVDGGWMGR